MKTGYDEALKFLVESEAILSGSVDLIHTAVNAVYRRAIKAMVNRGVEISIQIDGGLTPLNSAIVSGRPEIMSLPVRLGATATNEGRRANEELSSCTWQSDFRRLPRLKSSCCGPL